jgi:hypothetical protein
MLKPPVNIGFISGVQCGQIAEGGVERTSLPLLAEFSPNTR